MSSDNVPDPAYGNSASCVGSSNGFNPMDAVMAVLDESNTLPPEEKEEIKKWIQAKKELRIIATGKTGAGKSSLLNCFVGQKIFSESSDDDDDDCALDPCTTEVTQYEFEKGGLKVIVWDCPGLQDGSNDEEKYLQSLVDKTNKDVDLMVYCVDMSQSRAVDLHVHGSAIKKLTEVLGPNIWKNTVIALTFANMFIARLEAKHPGITQESGVEKFKARIKLWRSKVEEVLHELGIPDDVSKALPVFPAGYHTQPHLPGYPYWSSHMWMTTLHAVKECAQPLPIIMNASRFRERPSPDEDSSLLPPEEQPIYYNADVNELAGRGMFAGVAVGGVVGSAANVVVTGTALGGVYVINVGGIIGMTVGGAVGLGIGAAVGLLIYAYHRHERE